MSGKIGHSDGHRIACQGWAWDWAQDQAWDWAQYSMQDWNWWAQHSGKENLVDWLVRPGLYGYIEELSVGDLNQPKSDTDPLE